MFKIRQIYYKIIISITKIQMLIDNTFETHTITKIFHQTNTNNKLYIFIIKVINLNNNNNIKLKLN